MEFDYVVLNVDKDCFMMKSECDKFGDDYIDMIGDLLEDCDEDEIEQFLYGQNY